jgi:hypothetical protein
MGVVQKFIFKVESPRQQKVAEIIFRKVGRAVIERQRQWFRSKGHGHRLAKATKTDLLKIRVRVSQSFENM